MTALLLASLVLAGVGERRAAGRPDLLGPARSQLSDDSRFRVHWSDDPTVSPAGGRTDDVPDAVGLILDAIAEAESAYALRGYRPITADDGAGGDDALDLYLLPIDINGYAYPLVGESPQGGAACYIELDNSLRGIVLASVVQHELFHCVQYRYTVHADGWIYEASATWEQYQLADPGLDLGLQLLYRARIAEPDRPLDSRGDRYEYAGFLVFKHLEELRRPAPRSLDVWTALSHDPDWKTALDRVTGQAFDRSLAEWFAEYSTYNAFACSLDDGAHYAERLGCTLPDAVPLTAIEHDESVHVVLSGGLTSQTLELSADSSVDAVEVRCEAVDSGLSVVTLVSVDADGVAGAVVRSGVTPDAITLRSRAGLDPDGSARIIIASVGEDDLDQRCTASRVASVQASPAGCSTTPTPPWTWLILVALSGIRGRRGTRRHS